MEKVVFHIGELSNLFNISVDSIRYYEKMGLMPEPKRLANGYRDYDEASLKQFRYLHMHLHKLSRAIKGLFFLSFSFY